MKFKKLTSILTCLVSLPLVSCASESHHVHGHDIYIIPSQAFDKAASAFTINKDQALALALKYRAAQRPDIRIHVIGSLAGIVDKCYVFSLPQKDGIPLSGIYVNGDSGAVEEKIFPFKIVDGKLVKDKHIAPSLD